MKYCSSNSFDNRRNLFKKKKWGMVNHAMHLFYLSLYFGLPILWWINKCTSCCLLKVISLCPPLTPSCGPQFSMSSTGKFHTMIAKRFKKKGIKVVGNKSRSTSRSSEGTSSVGGVSDSAMCVSDPSFEQECDSEDDDTYEVVRKGRGKTTPLFND